MLSSGRIGRSWAANYTTTSRLPLHPSLGPPNTPYPPAHHLLHVQIQKDGDQDESRKVFDACRGFGFFYLTNTNIDYNFMFDLAQDVFDLPLDTKMKYEMGNTGAYYGYKMSGSNYVDEKGTPDKSEFYKFVSSYFLSSVETAWLR